MNPKPRATSAIFGRAGCLVFPGLAFAALVFGLAKGSWAAGGLVLLFLALALASLFLSARQERQHQDAVLQWRRSISLPAGDAWKKQFAAEGIAHLIETVQPNVRPALRLEKTPFDGVLGRSRLGGLPDLPVGVKWPGQFLAQIHLGEVAASWPESPLPKSGSLWFFQDEAEGSVHFAPEDTTLERAAGTQHARGIGFIPFEDIPELVPRNQLAEDVRNYLGGQHKMFGYANWVQGEPETGAPAGRRLLLQLDTDQELGVEPGDAGTLYFLIRDEDLQQCRFEQAIFEMQCS